MSTKKKILICDDAPASVERWRRQLDKLVDGDFEIECFTHQPLVDEVQLLEARRIEARRRKRSSPDWDSPFDHADILIVDYDLINLRKNGKSDYLTGEIVAYLARCYSRCGFIVGLNQFGANPFDLTLHGHPESYADLNIGDRQLANEGLWKGNWKGFRPWAWSLLPLASSALEHRSSALVKNLHKPILKYLKFPPEVQAALPRATMSFLSLGKRAEDVTFEDFVLKSGNGLRTVKEEPSDQEQIARIAAARIGKWLERLILPGQDILVDAPHLVTRYPSLIKGNRERLETWNSTTTLPAPSSATIDIKTIEPFRFEAEDWLSRSAWYWTRVASCEAVKEVAQPWSTARPDFVFCEDVSCFLRRDSAREFVGELSSPFVRRFVSNPKASGAKRFSKSLKGVEYRPSLRLSL